MSITGTGTQADPYIVETYEDLKTAIEYGTPDDLYVKFKEKYNIDLASIYEYECPTIYTSNATGHNVNVDGNGTTISGFSSSKSMFKVINDYSNPVAAYFHLKNIVIDKAYCPSSPLIFEGRVPQLENVKISAVIEDKIAMRFSYPGSSYHSYQVGYVRRCSFSINKSRYDFPNNTGRLVIFGDPHYRMIFAPEFGGDEDYGPPIAGIPITDCKFEINSLVSPLFFGAGGNPSSYSNARPTKFLRNTIILNGSTPLYLGGWVRTFSHTIAKETSIANSVIRGNSSASIQLRGATSADEFDSGVCVIDHTSLPNASLVTTEGYENPFKLLTAEEIKNPAYLRSIGFECGG